MKTEKVLKPWGRVDLEVIIISEILHIPQVTGTGASDTVMCLTKNTPF